MKPFLQPAPQAHDEPGSRQHQVLLVVDGARQQKLAQLPRALPPRLQDSGRLPGTSGSRPAAVPDVQLGIRQRGLESPPAPHEVHPEPGRLGPVLRVRLFRRDPAASRQQQPGRLHERPRSRDRFSSGTRLHREHSGKMRVDTNRKFLCHTKKNRDFVFSLTGENDLEGESVTHCDINQLFLEYIFLERRFDS